MIGEDYNLALGINFDYTSLVFANRILVDLMSAEADLQSALWQEGDSKQLADLFDQCVGHRGQAGGRADQEGPDEASSPCWSSVTPFPSASLCPTWPSTWVCPDIPCINT